MTCQHKQTYHSWVPKEDYYTGEVNYEWETAEVYTTVDLDDHFSGQAYRYQCTQCHKVMYYSGAARRYYEEDIADDHIA